MRLPRRSEKHKPAASPEDTQEMFTSGQPLPEDPEETREYEVVGIEDEEPVEELAEEPVEEGEDLEAIEDEAWEGDEYEDWEEGENPDEFEEADDEVPEDEAPGPEADPGERSGFAVFFAGFKQRVSEVWSGFWGRIGAVKLPSHELNGQKILAVAGMLAIALMVGAGGYLIGRGSGEDVDQARLEGEFAGKKAGAIAGATRGYAAGFKKGRDIAFRKSYSASYKRNYIRAYEDAGMDPPKPEDIEVPEP